MNEVPDEEVQGRPDDEDLLCAQLSDERIETVLGEFDEEDDSWPFESTPDELVKKSLARLSEHYGRSADAVLVALVVKACDDLDALMENDRADLQDLVRGDDEG